MLGYELKGSWVMDGTLYCVIFIMHFRKTHISIIKYLFHVFWQNLVLILNYQLNFISMLYSLFPIFPDGVVKYVVCLGQFLTCCLESYNKPSMYILILYIFQCRCYGFNTTNYSYSLLHFIRDSKLRTVGAQTNYAKSK